MELSSRYSAIDVLESEEEAPGRTCWPSASSEAVEAGEPTCRNLSARPAQDPSQRGPSVSRLLRCSRRSVGPALLLALVALVPCLVVRSRVLRSSASSLQEAPFQVKAAENSSVNASGNASGTALEKTSGKASGKSSKKASGKFSKKASGNHSAEKDPDEGTCHGPGCSCDCSWASESHCSKDDGGRCWKKCCSSSTKRCKSRGGCSCDCSWASKETCDKDDSGCCWKCCCGDKDGLPDKLPDEQMKCMIADNITLTHNPATYEPGTLFCFSVMLPSGYERGLIQMQHEQHASIFACEEFAVYSNMQLTVAPGVVTSTVDSDLKCDYGGEFKTALNTDIFLAVWNKVIYDSRYAYHNWTVKVDPDTVFFPWRLRAALKKHPEGPKGVYLNNCKYGLHGPIEVFSRNAVVTWARGQGTCTAHFKELCKGPCWWGEDMFIDQCLCKVLGVRRDNNYRQLSEAHCDPPEGWDSCQNPLIMAFHPFKDIAAYKTCLHNGNLENPPPTTTTITATMTTSTTETVTSLTMSMSTFAPVVPVTTQPAVQLTPSPVVSEKPAPRKGEGCDEICVFNSEHLTCKALVWREANTKFSTERNPCVSSIVNVNLNCPKCWACSLEESECRTRPSSPTIPAPGVTTEATDDSVPQNFDCTVGLENWQFEWSPDKMAWCCKKTGQGCSSEMTVDDATPKPYDCTYGYSDVAVATWSTSKRTWCCAVKGMGCMSPTTSPCPYDCLVEQTNWEASWSPGKKAWCCQHQNVGCPQVTSRVMPLD